MTDATPATPVVITVRAATNGPLLVNGPFVIQDAAGNVIREGTKCALCRCGQSKNKPFCDGSHAACGFQAP
jgi:CDGSH-type Zn-finger protein